MISMQATSVAGFPFYWHLTCQACYIRGGTRVGKQIIQRGPWASNSQPFRSVLISWLTGRLLTDYALTLQGTSKLHLDYPFLLIRLNKSKMSRRVAAPADRAAQNQQTIKALLKLEGNKICADCKRNKHPRWASWNLGVFVCIRCSGIHRGMGTHISR